jgi:hypothetical protein
VRRLRTVILESRRPRHHEFLLSFFTPMSSNVTLSPDLLPNSLRLPAHLSAHKYFFVCTLTVAAWDTLVLSPRSWKLFKSEGWPVLKAIFFFLRFLMPIEFTIVGMSSYAVLFDAQPTNSLSAQASHSLTLPGRDRYIPPLLTAT